MKKIYRLLLTVIACVALSCIAAACTGGEKNNKPSEPTGATIVYTDSSDGNGYAVKSVTLSNGITVAEVPDTYEGKAVTEIGKEAFKGALLVTEVKLPSTITTIGEGAFRNCKVLAKINLPDALTSIDGEAFKGCEALTEVKVPNGVTKLSSGLFENCKKLHTVTVGSGVTEIMSSVFSNTALKSFVIPEGVKSIGYLSVFNGCSALTEITLPAALTYLAQGTFKGCTALVKVNYNGTTDDWCNKVRCVGDDSNPMAYASQFYAKNGGTLARVTEITVPNGTTEIIDRKFEGFAGINITLSDTVTKIGNAAFRGCSIENLVIPDGVKFIGSGAYANCGLKTVKIGKGVEYIEGDAFVNNGQLASITFVNTEGNPNSTPSSRAWVMYDGQGNYVKQLNVAQSGQTNALYFNEAAQNGGAICWSGSYSDYND